MLHETLELTLSIVPWQQGIPRLINVLVTTLSTLEYVKWVILQPQLSVLADLVLVKDAAHKVMQPPFSLVSIRNEMHATNSIGHN